jgi:hypothetical protein
MKGGLRGRLGLLQQALAGSFREHHAFVLHKLLEPAGSLNEKVACGAAAGMATIPVPASSA